MTAIFCILFSGCYYDNAEELYPSSPDSVSCNTDSVTYAADVLPIILQNCAVSGCHLGPNAEDGSDLSQYGPLKNYADNSLLYSSISHDGTSSAMPKDAPKLDNCSIAVIKKWIDNGAPNN